MKKSILAAALLAFAICVSKANLITNGNFNGGNLDGWQTFGVAASTDGLNNSFGAVLTQPDITTWSGLLQQVGGLNSNSFYDLSFYIRVTGATSEHTGSMGLSWNHQQIFHLDNVTADTDYIFVSLRALRGNGFADLFTLMGGVVKFSFDDFQLVENNHIPENMGLVWIALPLLGMLVVARLNRKP